MILCDSKQLENGRWGIMINNQMVATIGCFDTCQKIINFLEVRMQNQHFTPPKADNSIVPYFHQMKLRA